MKPYLRIFHPAMSGLLLACSLFALQPVGAQTSPSATPVQEQPAVANYEHEAPAIKTMGRTQEVSPEELLQAKPSAAGARITQRQMVNRELQRARQRGELEWLDRESTGYQR